jgi:hypothetical protein
MRPPWVQPILRVPKSYEWRGPTRIAQKEVGSDVGSHIK